MAVLFLLKQKFIIALTLISTAQSCFNSGYALDVPGGQMIADALLCFNNKVIYSGCNEAYRLTERGNLNVPPEATDLFCTGPCVTETRAVLSCINNVLSDFIFYNRATVRDIRHAINAGCSNTNLRGNFNVARYIEGETSSADLLAFYAFTLTAGVGVCLCIL